MRSDRIIAQLTLAALVGAMSLSNASTASAAAIAQELALPGDDVPPAIEGATYLQTLIERLDEERAEIAEAERGAPESARITYRAMLNVRILASELLAQAEAHRAEGSICAVLGLQLAHGRHLLDAELTQLMGLPAQKLWRPLSEVKRFDDLAVDLATTIRTTDEDALTQSLARILTPLADAVIQARAAGAKPADAAGSAAEAMPPAALRSAWPTRAEIGLAPLPRHESTLTAEGVQSVRAIRGALTLDEEPAAHADLILGFLTRALPHVDLHARAEPVLQALRDALMLRQAAEGAESWLSDAMVARYTQRTDQTLADLADPHLRDLGLPRAARLAQSARLLRAIQALRDSDEVLPTIRRTLRDTLIQADALTGDEELPASPSRELDRLAEMVERMQQFRDEVAAAAPREVRVVYDGIARETRRVEKTVLDELGRLLEQPSLLTDPGFVSLTGTYRRSVDELALLRRVPALVQSLSAHKPDAQRLIAQRLQRLAELIGRPEQRETATGALRRIEDELARFAPFSFEVELRAGTPAADLVTGGQQAELIKVIDAARARWASTWSAIELTDAPPPEMVLLERLCRMLSTGVRVESAKGTTSTLARWAGWEAPATITLRTVHDLPARLKLATFSIITGDPAGAADQLDRLEREVALAELLADLATRLAPALADRTDDGLHLLSRLIIAPTPSSWLGSQRRRLAGICWYALETQFAQDAGSPESAPALRAWVTEQIGRLDRR